MEGREERSVSVRIGELCREDKKEFMGRMTHLAVNLPDCSSCLLKIKMSVCFLTYLTFILCSSEQLALKKALALLHPSFARETAVDGAQAASVAWPSAASGPRGHFQRLASSS
jgi:hypothetical protein